MLILSSKYHIIKHLQINLCIFFKYDIKITKLKKNPNRLAIMVGFVLLYQGDSQVLILLYCENSHFLSKVEMWIIVQDSCTCTRSSSRVMRLDSLACLISYGSILRMKPLYNKDKQTEGPTASSSYSYSYVHYLSSPYGSTRV